MYPKNINPVCYLSNEFAIDSDLPTYSGGLGVLAGDLMKEAADQEFPMVGIGILYKGKEFMQHITGEGLEEQRDAQFDHDTSFLRQTTKDGKPLELTIPMDGYEVNVKSYHVRLSDSCILYFLSTDLDSNPQEWVWDMDALYRGDHDSQIRQQIILGVGGIKLLKELGITPNLYHINEGRPEFIIWELVRQNVENGMNFSDAWSKAKQMIVYTNHTLVSAGNLEYNIDTIRYWANPFAKALQVQSDDLIKDGFKDGRFSITLFALNNSRKHSAVSKIHGKYCKTEWKGFSFESITNGVHMPTWQDSDYRRTTMNDREMWAEHMQKKRELARSVLERTGFGYDPSHLVVSWARRLAEYKQPLAVFSDIARFKAILSQDGRPVQFLIAGNSHSGDANAKHIIETIINYASKELSGHVIFIPNYNISLANHLTSGSDVWLNTPKGNLEACGTSGMKAISNGVLQCTVLDGWTYEVDWNGIGWVLDPNNVAIDFYKKMEDEIVPLYYKLDQDGLPVEWIQMMRKSIEVSKNFSTTRMLKEYKDKLYKI